MFLYLLYNAPTCFGHISCPSANCLWQVSIYAVQFKLVAPWRWSEYIQPKQVRASYNKYKILCYYLVINLCVKMTITNNNNTLSSNISLDVSNTRLPLCIKLAFLYFSLIKLPLQERYSASPVHNTNDTMWSTPKLFTHSLSPPPPPIPLLHFCGATSPFMAGRTVLIEMFNVLRLTSKVFSPGYPSWIPF
jgi:hypothetical protein